MLITRDIDGFSNCWIYDIFLEIEGQIIDLHFESIPKGWKSDIRGGWCLAVPKLNVTRFLINDDESITASGESYHDHNLHYIYSPFVKHGGYWGNFNADTLSITWAEIKKNIFSSETMIVANPNEMNFF